MLVSLSDWCVLMTITMMMPTTKVLLLVLLQEVDVLITMRGKMKGVGYWIEIEIDVKLKRVFGLRV